MNAAALSKFLSSTLGNTETFLAASFLATAAVLPVVEMLLRSLWDIGIPGATGIRANLTLWVGFLGAMLASQRNQHLRISVAAELLPEQTRPWIGAAVGFVCTAAAAGLAWGAIDFVIQESGSQVVIAGMPIWLIEVIFPIAFVAITLRFIGQTDGPWGRLCAVLGGLLAAFFGFGLEAPDDFVLWTGLLALFVAFVLGAPIFVILGGAALLLFANEDVPVAAIHVEAYRLVSSPAISAIPLFALNPLALT